MGGMYTLEGYPPWEACTPWEVYPGRGGGIYTLRYTRVWETERPLYARLSLLWEAERPLYARYSLLFLVIWRKGGFPARYSLLFGRKGGLSAHYSLLFLVIWENRGLLLGLFPFHCWASKRGLPASHITRFTVGLVPRPPSFPFHCWSCP